MIRILPFILIAAILGGGLYFLATSAPESTPVGVEPSARTRPIEVPVPRIKAPALEEVPAATASIDRAETVAEVPRGLSPLWRIRVLNGAGQPLPDAQITATHEGKVMTATGEANWVGLTPGSWSLVIEWGSAPTWENDVVVAAGESTLTNAKLGPSIGIRGEVLDTGGGAVAGARIAFVPEGPTAETTPTINGKTAADGMFRVNLPKAGTYRLMVGNTASPRWQAESPRAFKSGGPNMVRVTIPAVTMLVMEISGEEIDRPTEISAWIFDQDLAARDGTAEAQAEEQAQRTDTAEKEGASGSGGQATSNDLPLFEPGWRQVEMQRTLGRDQVIFERVQPGIDVRFLFRRGRDLVTTFAPVRLPEGQRMVATFDLGPAITGGRESVKSNTAAIQLRSSPGGKKAEGAVWSRADQ